MKLKLRMILMSHLSDAQECLGVGMSQEMANTHINFVKYLFGKQIGLNDEIDADKVWTQFLEKHNNKTT